MTRWLEEAEQFEEKLICLRRDLHMYPELGNQEQRTTQVLKKALGDLGLEIKTPLETGLTADLKGNHEGPVVALRADIDALPVEEKTGVSFVSRNPGIMHACGHDIHMAALAGCARLLCSHRDELYGTVRFILQPDEEGEGGAERLIRAGVLDDVSAVFGAHVNPELEAGRIGIRYGAFYAAAVKFDVTVHGRSCHGAEPEKGIDALDAAARMCTALKQLTDDDTIVSIGAFQAGTVRNIIAGTASFSGISRVMGMENREKVKKDIERTINEIAEETGTRAEITIENGYPGVVNHTRETALAEQCAIGIFGEEHSVLLKKGTMTTEDFGCYLLNRPGSYYHIGCGSDAPLHSPYFLPDEKSIICGAAMHAGVLCEYLKEYRNRQK